MRKTIVLLVTFITVFLMTTCGVEQFRGEDGDDGATGERGQVGETGKQGIKGDSGRNGTNGVDGKDGDKGDTGDTGIDGRDGVDGVDAVLEVIDPCGDAPDQYDEVLVQMDGCIAAYFQDGAEEFLVCLPDGNYQTTDKQACRFSIVDGMLED